MAPTADPGRARSRSSRRRGAAATYLALLLLSVLFAGPLAWLVLAALKTPVEWVAIPIRLLPETPQWGNFGEALTRINYPVYALNSLLLSSLYAVLITASSATVGFGFARLRGPGKRALFLVLLATMMLPSILTLIPTYVLFSRLGLVNTYWPWVLWGLAASPFLVFLFRQFFVAIPGELEEAAIIDGCGYAGVFVRIFLPVSRPVLVTSFLLSFTWVWGDYLAPALLLDSDHTTLSVAILQGYRDLHGNYVPTLQAAAAVLYVLPVVVIFLFTQRYFVRSVVTSGLKG